MRTLPPLSSPTTSTALRDPVNSVSTGHRARNVQENTRVHYLTQCTFWAPPSPFLPCCAADMRVSVLNDCLQAIVNAERRGKRQVLIRPSSKVIIKFLQVMQKHGMYHASRYLPIQPPKL